MKGARGAFSIQIYCLQAGYRPPTSAFGAAGAAQRKDNNVQTPEAGYRPPGRGTGGDCRRQHSIRIANCTL
jgi:hypothetical protein